MNFKSPYPWAESGRLCIAWLPKDGYDNMVFDYTVEIVSYDYSKDKYYCRCRFLEDNGERFVFIDDLDPMFTVEEIMQYAEKTIIEEHWVDYNSNECAIYLMKFCGEYFRIDECGNIRKMEKVKI